MKAIKRKAGLPIIGKPAFCNVTCYNLGILLIDLQINQ